MAGELEPIRSVATACPFCGGPGPFQLVCGACGSGHHAECWQLSGGCAVAGCASRLDQGDTPPHGLDVLVVDVEPEELDIDDGRRRIPSWAWWVGGATLLLAVAIPLALLLTRPAPPAPQPTEAPVIVPQVEGLPFDTARSELTELGLLLRFEMVPSDEAEDGTVLEQSIPPLSSAQPGDTIELLVAAEPPAATSTPTDAAEGTAASETATAGPATPADGAPSPASPDPPAPSGARPGGPALDPPFIAIVESPRDRARAEAFAEDYRARGYDAAVLASDDYPAWAPGVFVVYVARFADRAAGVAFCEAEFDHPRGCYVLDTRAR